MDPRRVEKLPGNIRVTPQIPPDFLDKLRSSVDLTKVAEALGVEVKRAGRSVKACCPLHGEKTPSFVISERRNGWGWHCFGCGEKGDAIDLAMAIKGFTFIEAVEYVASVGGLRFIRAEVSPQAAEKREKEKLRRAAILEAMEVAALWFEAQLAAATGEDARTEIDKRGFPPETVKAFRLGYAPGSNELLQELSRAKVPMASAVEAGLISPFENGSGFYVRFKNRLIFPITDRAGRVVGFSGRDLTGKADAKYVNTKEIEGVFVKGSLLFGIAQAHLAARKAGKINVVEGHADVTSMHARGYPNTVGLMGTALTEEHVLLLESLGVTVVLLLDGDKAGVEATWRAVPLLTSAQIPSMVATLPDEEDPDSLLRKDPAALAKVLDDAAEGVEAWVQALLLTEPNQIMRARLFSDEIIPVLAALPGPALHGYLPIFKKAFSFNAKMVNDGIDRYNAKIAEEKAEKAKANQAKKGRGDKQYVGDFVVKNGETHIVKEIRTNEDTGEEFVSTKLILTGVIKPIKRVRLGMEGEVLVADIVHEKRKVSVSVTLDSKVWASRRNFKESLPTMDVAWLGTDDELALYMVFLSRAEVPIVRGTRVLGYHLIDGKWSLVCSDKTLLQGGDETRELIHWADGETGMVYDTGQITPAQQIDFEAFARDALAFSTAPKVASILGWMGAVPLKMRLAHMLRDKRFPYLELWGERGAAKSAYVEQLILDFFGGQVAPSNVNQIKAFTAMLTCALSNLVPFAMDENKGALLKQEHSLLLSESIRNAYQGASGKRGRKDGTSQRSYPAVAPLIVAGEDSVMEPAAQERRIEVFLSKKVQAPFSEGWRSLRRTNLAGLGYDYLRWCLELSDERIERTFREIHDDQTIIRTAFRDRIRHNVAVAIFGFRMLAEWLAERGHGWKPEWVKEFSQALERDQYKARYPNESGKNKSIVDQILELMSAAAANRILRRGVDFTTQHKDGQMRLCVRLQKVYPLIAEWAGRTRYQGEVIHQEAFLAQLKQEPYFVESSKSIRFTKNIRDVFKCVILDAEKLKEMAIGVEGFLGLPDEDVGEESSSANETREEAAS